MSNSPQISRHEELLIDSVLFGLDDIEATEFTKLNNQQNQDFNSNQPKVSFELAAAALDLSMINIEPMPSMLAERIASQGRAFCANFSVEQTSSGAQAKVGSGDRQDRESNESTADPDSKLNQTIPAVTSRWTTASDFENTVTDNSVSPREILSWATAATIAFVAFFVWSTGSAEKQIAERKIGELRSENQLLFRDLTSAQETASQLNEARANESEKLDAFKAKAEFAELELQKLREKLVPDGEKIYQQVAKSENVIRWAWEDLNEQGISGDLVWNTDEQLGSMKISGLPKNDPTMSQYQLWIIEENGRELPVDGGVFDIQSDGVVYVVMQPKLVASKPAKFAITVEKPGGVVRSKLEKLPLMAKAPEEK